MTASAGLRRDGRDPHRCLNLTLFFCPLEVVAGLAEGEGCMFSACCTCLRMKAKHQQGWLPGTHVLARVVFQCRKSSKIRVHSQLSGVGSDFIVIP